MLFIFIFFLDYGNDVRHKVNSEDFLEFKTGYRAAETTHNINNTFGSRTANEHMVQWWFKRLCKGDKCLEDEENSGQPMEIDNNN